MRLYTRAITDDQQGNRIKVDIMPVFNAVALAVFNKVNPTDIHGNPIAKTPAHVIAAQVFGTILPGVIAGIDLFRMRINGV